MSVRTRIYLPIATFVMLLFVAVQMGCQAPTGPSVGCEPYNADGAPNSCAIFQPQPNIAFPSPTAEIFISSNLGLSDVCFGINALPMRDATYGDCRLWRYDLSLSDGIELGCATGETSAGTRKTINIDFLYNNTRYTRSATYYLDCRTNIPEPPDPFLSKPVSFNNDNYELFIVKNGYPNYPFPDVLYLKAKPAFIFVGDDIFTPIQIPPLLPDLAFTIEPGWSQNQSDYPPQLGLPNSPGFVNGYPVPYAPAEFAQIVLVDSPYDSPNWQSVSYQLSSNDLNKDGKGDLLLQLLEPIELPDGTFATLPPHFLLGYQNPADFKMVKFAPTDWQHLPFPVDVSTTPAQFVNIDGDNLTDVIFTDGSDNTAFLGKDIMTVANNNGTDLQFLSKFYYATPETSLNVSTDLVGSSDGKFRVSESGGAHYEVPIITATGTAGVSPHIGIQYASDDGNGIGGNGVSLTGLSSIARCRQTLSQDGQARPISFSKDDRFCLDGQRLILTSGTYGLGGSVYRTELDSYTEITAVGGTIGSPDYFTVVKKDGSTTHYGNGNNSKHTVSNTTVAWAISEFKDSVGNPIKYSYAHENGHSPRISRIDYAYAGSSSAGNSDTYLAFSYEDRPIPIEYYISNLYIKQQKRLTRITSYNNNSELRSYWLAYGASLQVFNPDEAEELQEIKGSYLKKLYECVGNSCYEPIVFEWAHNTELGFAAEAQSNVYRGDQDDRGVIDREFADFNGDGCADMAWVEVDVDGSEYNGKTFFRYALSDCSQLHPTPFADGASYKKFDKVNAPLNGKPRKGKIAVLDYNADGRSDIAWYRGVWNSTSLDWDFAWEIYLSVPLPDGTGWKISGKPISTGLTGAHAAFADINGDGLADYVNLEDNMQFALLEPAGLSISQDQFYRFGTLQPMTLSNSSVDWSASQIVSAQDFNQDGVNDLLVQVKSSNCATYCLDLFIVTHYLNGTVRLERKNILTEDRPVDWDTFPSVSTTDFNGDGLPDLLYTKRTRVQDNDLIVRWFEYSYYRIGKGSSFGNEVSLTQWSTGQGSPKIAFPYKATDYNRDGFGDLIVGNRYYRWNPVESNFPDYYGFTLNASECSTPDLTYSEIESIEFTTEYFDINGDGITDKIGIGPEKITTCLGRGSATKNLVTRITNGLNAVTAIQYETLSKSSHYEHLKHAATTSASQQFTWLGEPITYQWGASSQTGMDNFYRVINGDWSQLPSGALPPGTQTLGKTGPILEFNAPINVVTRITSSAPRADNTLADNVNHAAASSIDYYYAQGRIQASGRGFLGFQSVKTIDKQSGIQTITNYRQDFPFVGYPLATEVKDANGNRLKYSINHYAFQNYDGGSGAHESAPYRLVTARNEETTYEPSNGEEVSYAVFETAQDAWGNVTSTIQSTYNADDHDTFLTQVETTNTYGSTVYDQQFGRLSESTVDHRRAGANDISKTSQFTYYTSGSQKGLLKSEQASAAGVTFAGTTYVYDSAGNKIRASLCQGTIDSSGNCSVTPERYTRWVYDTDKRYVDAVYNALENGSWSGTAEELVTARHSTFGLPTEIQIPNGLITNITYDELGREIYRSDTTGAWTETLFSKADLSAVPGARYKVTTNTGGGGSSSEYFDRLARSIAKATVGFDGSLIWSKTEYDDSGRVKRQSVPHYEGGAYWTVNNYDDYGRLTGQTLPDSSDNTVVYDTNNVTTTNDKGQTRTEYSNAAGELLKVVDHINGSISYEYDASGQLSKTLSKDNDLTPTTTIEVAITYDAMGRKIKMLDPDKGTWFYSYNAYGELVKQYKVTSTHRYTGTLAQALADPLITLQHSKMAYDPLGRMSGRWDYLSKTETTLEGQSSWSYDTTANGLGRMESESGGGLTKTYSYGSLGTSGRTDTTTLTDSGLNINETLSITYDSFGRVDTETNDLISSAVNTDSGTQYNYNNQGYLHFVEDIASSKTLYTVETMDAWGNVTEAVAGNGYTSQYVYNPGTGRLATIGASGINNLVSLSYSWDTLGNMTSRHDTGWNGSTAKNHRQAFCYDGLNRLIKTRENTLVGSCGSLTSNEQDQRYDAFGRITYKVGVGSYSYGTATNRPHAVQSTSVNNISYQYDNTGNMTSDSSGRSLNYTSYDKARQISKGNARIAFNYGADRSRWKRVDTDIASGQSHTTYYLGNFEKIVNNATNSYQIKRYIGGYALWTYDFNASHVQQGATKEQYLYKDVLGSTNLVTDGSGNILQHNAFNPWGERVNTGNWATTLTQSLLTPLSDMSWKTTRGFTGHEMMDAVGLIHMNGRIYDPRLGLFLQADPFIQASSDTQAFHRYAYVRNNPLRYTDPSGHFAFVLFAGFILAAAEAQAATIFVTMFVAGFVDAKLQGASTADALRAGLISGASAAAFSAVGTNVGWSPGDGAGALFANAMANGVVGGITSVLQGGKFGHGFAAAGLSAYAKPGIRKIGNEAYKMPLRVAARAAIGGTISKVTGGKFANGAATAAFSQLFNDEASIGRERRNNGGTKRYSARQEVSNRGSTKMPTLEPGIYPVIVDSFSVTSTPASVELGDIWVIDMANEQVLHYAYVGGGPAAGLGAVASREFGAAYLSDGGELEGFAFSGESDGVIGFGGTGTLAIPTVPLNPQSTSFTGGPAIGLGAGMSGIGSYAWFQKVYSFSNAPDHLPLRR